MLVIRGVCCVCDEFSAFGVYILYTSSNMVFVGMFLFTKCVLFMN